MWIYLMNWIRKNPLLLAALILVVAAQIWLHFALAEEFSNGQAAAKAEHNQAKMKATQEMITIREKQNEIRNRRPDTAALIAKLRLAEF